MELQSMSNFLPHNVSRDSGQQGLSLIGVMVATFILVSVILAILGLMARTEKIIGGSLEKFVAVNLAREGLELTQVQRDTNWLSPNPNATPVTWTDKLCDIANREQQQLAIDFDPASGNIHVINNPGTEQRRLYRTENGLWTHVQNDTTPTPYSRLITINCSQQGVTLDDVRNDIPATITLASTVTWQRNGKEQSVVIKGNLYDWFQGSNSIVAGQCEMGNPLYALLDEPPADGDVESLAEADRALQPLRDILTTQGNCTVGSAGCDSTYDANGDGRLTPNDLLILINLATHCFS